MKTTSLSADAAALDTLARDLWWCWQPDGPAFFEALDPVGWARTGHNPVALVADLDDARRVAGLERLRVRFDALVAAHAAYLDDTTTTWHTLIGRPLSAPVAYFSAEFGLHESLPTYSGGLGILAGDHLKSASDLGVPLVAVGLLYREGYVQQELTADGHQFNAYETYDFARLAVTPARLSSGEPCVVTVEIGERPVRCRVFVVRVGRVPLYLLDTDTDENDAEHRAITARLYGGDRTTRIRQELVLGVGGARALAALGIAPAVWHLNEGHSAFLLLERARLAVQTGAAPDAAAAMELGRRGTVFTTHTPVEAGHDRFGRGLIEQHLQVLTRNLNIDFDKLMAWGHWPQELDRNAEFNMTLLALHGCARQNGVAALHGEVSREMFARYYGDRPLDEVPITHVTNGVHGPTWQCTHLRALVGEHVGDPGFAERAPGAPVWKKVESLDDAAYWAWRVEAKRALFALVERRHARRNARLGLHTPSPQLDPTALTIGFARRFAPYKRAALLFSEPGRLEHILEGAGGPVQFLFAGKAHPADEPGKRLVEQVHRAAAASGGRVVLIEGYDMELGRALTRGVDVWLNNPRRPMEASGTSGMKAGMNGGLNLSVLDGWWPEGYDGENGWAIGEVRPYATEAEQDAADAASLYGLLEREVLPLYFDRGPDGLPHRWIARAKHAIATVTPNFSAHRQVRDYVDLLYAD